MIDLSNSDAVRFDSGNIADSLGLVGGLYYVQSQMCSGSTTCVLSQDDG